MGLFDEKYTQDLIAAINSSRVFAKEEEYMKKYNMTWAVIERLKSSLRYLRQHIDLPKTEEEFLTFMMFASIVVDASEKICKEYGEKLDKLETHFYFKHAYEEKPLKLEENEYPTDKEFFDYLRALTFAHPVGTNKAKFLHSKGEAHYSPWIFVNQYYNFSKFSNAVGVRIYYNNRNEIGHLFISYDCLLQYVDWRYRQISVVSKWLYQENQKVQQKWAQQKADVGKDDEETLINIIGVLRNRYAETHEFEELLEYYRVIPTYLDNRQIIDRFFSEVHIGLYEAVNAVNEMDEDRLYEIINYLLFARPKKVHNDFQYEIEKIFGYLRKEEHYSNIEYGLQMAEEFSEHFAKKWVVLRPGEMSFSEIKLLVTIACFFENKEQIELVANK